MLLVQGRMIWEETLLLKSQLVNHTGRMISQDFRLHTAERDQESILAEEESECRRTLEYLSV